MRREVRGMGHVLQPAAAMPAELYVRVGAALNGHNIGPDFMLWFGWYVWEH